MFNDPACSSTVLRTSLRLYLVSSMIILLLGKDWRVCSAASFAAEIFANSLSIGFLANKLEATDSAVLSFGTIGDLEEGGEPGKLSDSGSLSVGKNSSSSS